MLGSNSNNCWKTENCTYFKMCKLRVECYYGVAYFKRMLATNLEAVSAIAMVICITMLDATLKLRKR